MRAVIQGAAFNHGFHVDALRERFEIPRPARRCGGGARSEVWSQLLAYHGAFQPILAASLSMARAAVVPVADHLDHATRPDLVAEAVEHGVWVEAELGEAEGKDGVLDFDLIRRLRMEVPVPLVLHGSSGLSDADLARAVNAEMTKINIATRPNDAFTRTVRARLAGLPGTADTRKYLGPAREAVSAEVAHLLTVLRSAGRRQRRAGASANRPWT
ncbi:class II fructose-bisphosphate aldolase [Spirillospora sp. CA-142024]|uniref:class II fructose-bisphosphate aldolase n=1 Tax=Spirillospora sp. CA-142024 TaxID=3240036 RepID=UPI003D8EBCB2